MITVSVPLPLFCWGGNFQSQILKRGDEKKMSAEGDLEFLPWIFAWGAYYVFLSKKDLQIKYGFDGAISNVNFGLF